MRSGKLSLLFSAGWEMGISLRATGEPGECLVWLIGVVVCMLVVPHVQLFSSAVIGRITRCSIISSCQSAATYKTCKALVVASPTHESSAIASTRTIYL